MKTSVFRKKRAYLHSAKRAEERYNLLLSKRLYEELNKKIRRNDEQVKRMKKLSNIRSVYEIMFEGEKKLYVIYHKKIDGITTFLPIDKYGNYEIYLKRRRIFERR